MNIWPLYGFVEPVNSITHFAGAALGLVGMGLLLHKGRGNWVRMLALAIFGLSQVFLFSMSAVYHLLEPGTVAKAVFQRLDHAAIWTLIFGTFVPIHFILFRGMFWRWGFLLLIFTIAVTGLIFGVIFLNEIPEWLSLSFFIGLGWMGLMSGWRLIRVYDRRVASYLVLGGVLYTIGAVLDYLRWPVIVPYVLGPHEIFHFFVLAAAYCHWQFIFDIADRPVVNNLQFYIRDLGPDHFVAEAAFENLQVTASSIEEVEAKVVRLIDSQFHGHTRPRSLLFKYTKEKVFQLSPE